MHREYSCRQTIQPDSEGEIRMAIRGLVVLLVMGGAVTAAPAKNKKDAQLPPLFCQARNVFVQTANGDPQGPGVAPGDRAAALALIAQLQNWKRYVIVTDPQQADLVWVVRAGRAAAPAAGNSGNNGANSGVGSQDASGMGADPNGPGTSRGGQSGLNGPGGPGGPGAQGGLGGPGGAGSMNPGSPGDSMNQGASDNRGAGPAANNGSADDILAVFQRPNGGPLSSPLWQKNLRGGLESPKMPLFEQIRNAVETTCAAPATPPVGQTATPPQ
jgi:hypothetical protein